MFKVPLFVTLIVFMPFSGFAQWEMLDGGFLNDAGRVFIYDSIQGHTYIFGGFDYLAKDTSVVAGTVIWKDETLQPLGQGVNWPASANAINAGLLHNNEIYVGGFFDSIGGIAAKGLARWNVDHWENWGTLDQFGWVSNIRSINGNIHVLGPFETVNGTTVDSWAIWDGNSWMAGDPFDFFSDPNNSGTITDAAIYNGELYIGGNFGSLNGPTDFARVGVNGWETVGGGIVGAWVNDLVVFNDLLFVCGYFNGANGLLSVSLIAWNGNQWIDPFPEIEWTSHVPHLNVVGNKLVVNGYMRIVGTNERYGICYYDGNEVCLTGRANSWTPYLGGSADTLYIGSGCETIDCEPNGFQTNRVAKWLLTNPVDTCIQQFSGFEEHPNTLLVVHPNPTNGTIRFNSGFMFQNAVFKISDILGRIRQESNLSGVDHTIVLGDIPVGVYLLTVIDQNGAFYSARVILE